MAPFRTRSGFQSDQAGMEPFRHQGASIDENLPSPPPYMPRMLAQRLPKSATGNRLSPHPLFGLFQVFATPLSLAVIGIIARSLELYDDSRNAKIVVKGGLIKLAWPSQGADLTPAYILIGAAGLSFLSSLFNTIAWCGPWRHIWLKRRGAVGISIFIALVSAFLLFAIVIFKTWNTNDSIFGWSCDLRSSELSSIDNEIGLGFICNSLYAAWAIAIAAAFFQVVSLALALLSIRRSGSVAQWPRTQTNYQKLNDQTEYQGNNRGMEAESETISMLQRRNSH